MRRSCRWTAPGLALLPLVLSASPALAAATSSTVEVDKAAWSWRKTVPVPGLPVSEPSQVPPGGLAVAADGDVQGRPAKATYLHLDLSAIPTSALVSTLTLTLPLHPDAESSGADGARLVACALLDDFRPGEATDPAAMPKDDCTGAPEGTYDDKAGAWVFDLSALASTWVAQPGTNAGVVVRPAPDYALPEGAPFQIVFSGAAKVRAELAYDVLPAPVVVPETTDAALGGGMDVGTAPPPPLSSGSAPVPAPPRRAPPVTAPAAAAAPPQAPALVPVPLREPSLASARTSPTALWALAAMVGLLLLAVARVAGDTYGPRAFARLERERLDRVRLRAPIALIAPVLPLESRQPVASLRRQVPQTRQGRRPIASATSTVT